MAIMEATTQGKKLTVFTKYKRPPILLQIERKVKSLKLLTIAEITGPRQGVAESSQNKLEPKEGWGSNSWHHATTLFKSELMIK